MNTDRDEILKAAANGNAAALEFLRVFARRAHLVDDVADDVLRVWMPKELADAEMEWLLCLATNPFFQQFKAQLVPVMVLALSAWVDSGNFTGDRQDIVKGQWHEVVWLVALLTGGPQHMSTVSSQFREYDFELMIERRAATASQGDGKEANGTVR